MTLHRAGPADIPALHALIESAYRGESAKSGWTHEADLLGGQRTDPDMLAAIIDDPKQALLLHHDGDRLTGCVCVADRGDHGYLGMLTVAPGLQGQGLGKRLIQAAETHIRTVWHHTRVRMTVIRQRAELIAWYQRLGYTDTGETEAFPAHDPRFGLPRQPLSFIVLEKSRLV
jgi:ribosomal protein S18 acetylase RimI-like enzyme